jgi:hypothetical protein
MMFSLITLFIQEYGMTTSPKETPMIKAALEDATDDGLTLTK